MFVAAAAVVIRFICTVLSSRMGYLSSKSVKKALREKIYRKLLRLGASYNEQVKTSEVAPLTLFVYLCFVNIPSAVVLLVCVPLIPVSIAAVRHVLETKKEKKGWGNVMKLKKFYMWF